MAGFLKELIFKANTVAGVEISALQDGSFAFSFQVLEKSGKNLLPKKSKIAIKDKQEFFSILKELKCPVIINYNGKGTIQRAFQDSIKDNFSEALNRLVPAANENDFHIQLYNSSNINSFACILRKSQLEEWLNEFALHKIDVIGFLLGSYHLELLLPLTGNGNASIKELVTSTQLLRFEDGGLKELAPLTQQQNADIIEIENTRIPSELFNSLAAAMYYFIPIRGIKNNNAVITELSVEHEAKKAFTVLSRSLLVFLLLLALGNFFWFNSYFKQEADVNAELSVFESSMNSYEQLNKQLKGKEDFLQKSGLLNGSKLSFYTDRILYDMPEEIQLNYFCVAPTAKRPEKDSVIRFDSNKILIKGMCSKSIILNEWLKLMKSKDFVADVVLENYNQELENKNGKFDIAVQLK